MPKMYESFLVNEEELKMERYKGRFFYKPILSGRLDFAIGKVYVVVGGKQKMLSEVTKNINKCTKIIIELRERV